MKTWACLTVFASAILFASCPGENDPCRECTASDPAGVGTTFSEEFCAPNSDELDVLEAEFRAEHVGYDITCVDND